MQTVTEDLRFSGIARLYGADALKRFQAAHVMVIGLGGVGSWVVEALARSGVGAISLVDFDDICVSNTNRQIHALSGQIGKMKTEALAERCRLINPGIQIKSLNEAFSQDSAAMILADKPDLVIDAFDKTRDKIHLVRACAAQGIGLVVIGSAGGRRDPSRVRVADLSLTRQDPMLALLRKQLRQKWGYPRKGSMSISCVFSEEAPVYPDLKGGLCAKKPEDFKTPLDCSAGFGTATMVTGTFAFFAVSLALEKLQKI